MKEGSAMLWKPDVCIYHGGCDDSRLDVSDIAKSYGGGGHRNAAGFEVPSERALRHPTQSG